jgi:hypothetical protein
LKSARRADLKTPRRGDLKGASKMLKHIPPLPPIDYSQINWRAWFVVALVVGFWVEVFTWL